MNHTEDLQALVHEEGIVLHHVSFNTQDSESVQKSPSIVQKELNNSKNNDYNDKNQFAALSFCNKAHI